MKTTTATVLSVVFSLFTAGHGTLEYAGAKSLKLRDFMTPEQFSQAGLPKLTSTELASLEQWLTRYTDLVAQVAASTNKNQSPSTSLRPSQVPLVTPDVIETCVDGDFEGWAGETIFKLCNGQIWQQSEYAYTYEYAYRPQIIIFKTSSGYRMKVEDVSETIGVTRIK